jgi:hypothetical protein
LEVDLIERNAFNQKSDGERSCWASKSKWKNEKSANLLNYGLTLDAGSNSRKPRSCPDAELAIGINFCYSNYKRTNEIWKSEVKDEMRAVLAYVIYGIQK